MSGVEPFRPSNGLLAEKLCALLAEPDLLGLMETRKLLEAGASLGHALAEAPRKSPDFSPLLLAWRLRGLEIHLLPGASEQDRNEIQTLHQFNEGLIGSLLAASYPDPLAS